MVSLRVVQSPPPRSPPPDELPTADPPVPEPSVDDVDPVEPPATAAPPDSPPPEESSDSRPLSAGTPTDGVLDQVNKPPLVLQVQHLIIPSFVA